jgi:protein-tyrosine kinase
MSKNFELLRQAGFKQDYFGDVRTETPPAEKINAPAGSPSTARYRAPNAPAQDDQISALVRKIFLDGRDPNVHSVVFSGVAPSAGCTWACAQTGTTLASMVDGTVCLVDANFAAPAINRQFGQDNAVGFSDAILQGKPARNFARQIDGSNLYVLSAGEEGVRLEPDGAGANVARCLRELRRDFDYLLVDAPPLAGSSTASTAGRAGDGAILVLESTGIALESLLKAKQHLKAARVPLFGVVLNGRKSPAHSLFGQFFK